MKICVYSDVHSNIEAYENLRKTEDYKSADLRIFLGDIVAVCPYPNECIETLLKSGDVWLMGNHDCYVGFGLPREEYPYFPGGKRDHQSYLRKIIKKEYIRYMMSLPKYYRITVGGKRLFFAHYSWETERLVYDDPEEFTPEFLDEIFAGVEADYIIFGHEHKSFTIKSKRATYICVDAVGVKHPGNYLMIVVDDKNFSFEKKKIDFDLVGLRKEMLRLNYPWAEPYTRYILEE